MQRRAKTLVFLTNHFDLPALTIAALYKNRWQVELFFKWIKQHLRIKKFYGTPENAVKTEIWIAVSVYVLVAIVKKRLALDASLYTLLQIFSIALFEKMSINQALAFNENKSCNSQAGSGGGGRCVGGPATAGRLPMGCGAACCGEVAKVRGFRGRRPLLFCIFPATRRFRVGSEGAASPLSVRRRSVPPNPPPRRARAAWLRPTVRRREIA